MFNCATAPLKPSPEADENLEALYKEIRLDFLSSMGEAERYKLLLDDMLHLRDKVEGDYLDARDRSSRLLGHLRAIEMGIPCALGHPVHEHLDSDSTLTWTLIPRPLGH